MPAASSPPPHARQWTLACLGATLHLPEHEKSRPSARPPRSHPVAAAAEVRRDHAPPAAEPQAHSAAAPAWRSAAGWCADPQVPHTPKPAAAVRRRRAGESAAAAAAAAAAAGSGTATGAGAGAGAGADGCGRRRRMATAAPALRQ